MLAALHDNALERLPICWFSYKQSNIYIATCVAYGILSSPRCYMVSYIPIPHPKYLFHFTGNYRHIYEEYGVVSQAGSNLYDWNMILVTIFHYSPSEIQNNTTENETESDVIAIWKFRLIRISKILATITSLAYLVLFTH